MQIANKLMKIFTLGFMLSTETNLFGQEYKGMLDNILPPTPQAANFMRYGEIPVSLSAGVPDISIPLFTIECDGYKLPISISYHASGIKVDDVASCVGLGWVLNAGGMISKVTMSAIDNPNGYCIKDASEWEGQGRHSLNAFDSLFYMSEEQHPSYDTESDRYYLSMPTKNCYFREDIQTGQYITIPYTPICFDYDSGWKITDADGSQYLFGETETCNSNNFWGETTGWNLTRIVTPNKKDTIVFSYELHHSSLITGSETYRYGKKAYLPEHSSLWQFQFLDPYTKSLYLNNYNENLLSEIKWKGNRIKFEYKADRLDRPGITSTNMKRLSRMLVINNGGDTIKTITFQKTESGNAPDNYRTLLSSVSIGDENYSFAYNMGTLPPYNKDTRSGSLKCHSDFWGYYNGKTSDHFVPFMNVNNWPLQNRCASVTNNEFEGKDKLPNDYYAQFGILKSITYPTGGTTKFEYEGNTSDDSQIKKWGGLRIKKITRIMNGEIQNYEVYDYPKSVAPLEIDEELFWSMRLAYYFDLYIPNDVSDSPTYTHTNHIVCESSSAIPIGGWWSAPLFYPEVVKTVYNKNGLVSMESKYEYETDDFHRDYWVENSGYPRYRSFYSNYDQGTISPLLKNRKDVVYSDGKAIDCTIMKNNYDIIDLPHKVVGVKVGHYSDFFFVRKRDICMAKADFFNDFFRVLYYDWYFYNIYAIQSYRRLSSTIEQKNGVETTTTYTYDPSGRTLQPLTVKTSRTGCSDVEKRYTYAFQSDDPVMQSMTRDNYVDLIVGERVLEGGVVSAKSGDIYKMENGRYLLAEKQYAVGNNPLETRLKMASHDTQGNVTEIVRDGDSHVFLVWGYNYQYPIMKIECPVGKDADCREYLRNKVEAIGASIVPDEKSVKEIRDYMEGKGSLVVTYQYKPLVGLTEVTDEKGIRTFYKYDNQNRLSAIYDADGRMIESYKYNYKK